MKKTQSLALYTAVVFALAGFSGAQSSNPSVLTPSNNTGTNPYETYGGSHENINMATGDLNIAIPLVTLPGRNGQNLVILQSYDSKIWQFHGSEDVNSNWTYWWDSEDRGGLFGWSPLVPKLFQSTVSRGRQFPATQCTGWILAMPDGSKHSFPGVFSMCYTNTMRDVGKDVNVGDSDDSAYIRIDTTNFNNPILHFKNGTKLWPQAVNSATAATLQEDTDGNIVTAYSTSTSIVLQDNLKRSATIDSSTAGVKKITYKDSSGQSRTVTLNYHSATLNPVPTFPEPSTCYANDSCTIIPPCNPASQCTFNLLDSIVLPNALSFTFTYNNYGEMTKITYPAGGYTRYDHAAFVHDEQVLGPTRSTFREVAAKHQCRSSSGARGSEDTTTYTPTIDYSKTNNLYMDEVDPLGNLTHYQFSELGNYLLGAFSPRELYRYIYQGSSTLLQTIQTDYTTGENTALPIRKTITLNDTNQVRKEEWDYQSYSMLTGINPNPGVIDNVIEHREFDYGTGAAGLLLRKTDTTWLKTNSINGVDYTATTLHILDRKATEIVEDPSSNPIAQSQYEYDSYTEGLTASGAVQHDSAYSSTYTTRGNLTASKHWRNTDGTWLTTRNQYDDAGNKRKTVDPVGNATTFSYADSWGDTNCIPTGGNAAAYLTSITNALTQTASSKYNSCSGTVASTTDLNSQTTNFYYDLIGRVIETDFPADLSGNRGQTTRTFNETLLPVNVTVSTKITTTISVSNNVEVDGLGRPRKTKLLSDPQGTTYTRTEYDALGRKYQEWNPTRCDPDVNPSSCSGESTFGITTYSYDAFSRTTQLIPPDGTSSSNNVTTAYSGNVTTITDQAGKSRKSQSDALGRMSTVWEDPNGLNYETDYQYDLLNNLTQAIQKGGTTDNTKWRTRTFAYDSLSELLTATNPESSQISYTYDNDGNASSKTSPAPNQTNPSVKQTISFCYDALNRLKSKWYTSPTCANSSPVANYFYDQTSYNGLTITNGIGRRTGMSDGSGATAWSYDSNGRALTERRTINGSTQNVSYTYNLDGSVATLTYPSGRVITYAYSAAARALSAVDATNGINYATAATYAPQGALASLSNGSSISGALTYNSRLQPLQIYYTTGTISSGTLSQLQQPACPTTTATIMDRSYNMALGVNNNGNVQSITNCRDSNRTQNFVYDSLNRISQGYTSGSNWGEDFTIDAWGNLTNRSVHSGKTNYEPLNAPANTNNQLTGFGYDAAGNMTANGSVTYTYDAENRLSSTAGYTYTYDGDGQRVKKANGSTGTLYWTGMGSDPLAESSLSGTMQEEYIFFNGKRVARRDVSNGAVHYYFSDHLGSHSAIYNASATTCEQDIDFYPYGGVEQDYCTGSGVAQNYKFTGKERDSESNLDNFGARYDASTLGRFMTPDWAAKPTTVPYASFGDPQSLNLYSYVANRPMTNVDPDGHGKVWPQEPLLPLMGSNLDLLDGNNNIDPEDELTHFVEIVAQLQEQHQQRQQAQKQDQKVLAVSSDTTHDKVTVMPAGVVKERDVDYTVGTMEKDKNFHRDPSNNEPTITMDEKQTGGNDHPTLCSTSTCSAKGTFEDNIRVSGPGKNFTTTQTFYIDGSKKPATIYTMRDGKLVSGTHAYVQATDKEVTVTYGP